MINNFKKARFIVVISLAFSYILVSCSGEKTTELAIEWQNGKAIAVNIPREMLPALPVDSLKQVMQVQLASNEEQPAILGEYRSTGNGISFYPLIPFTPGLKYEIIVGEESLGKIEIPATDPKDAPVVVEVYPTPDTLPENLLKLYIRFSKPMQQGASLKHITLIRDVSDTMTDTFLKLEKELWNNDRTVLTLWLDPGRIKRDLAPNLTMGAPLHKGERYEMIIQDDWRDAGGATLAKPWQKYFIVGERDSISPDIQQWTIESPAAGTDNMLTIYFHEPLDYMLLSNSIRIVDSSGTVVPGKIDINPTGTIFSFTPAVYWHNGNYTLECEARLEDLAGNNLSRPFDKDLLQKQVKEEKDVYKRRFSIQ